MAEEPSRGLGGAFGVYDVFAYIIPGFLVAAPLIWVTPFATLEFSAREEVVLAVLATVCAYLLGLVVHAAGAKLEGLLEEEYPSRSAISRLSPELGAKVQRDLRQHFDLGPEASEGQLWELAYRHLMLSGLGQRVSSFMLLHVVSRGLLIVLAWYAAISLFLGATADARWLFGLPVSIGFAFFFNWTRSRYNRRVAEEVLLGFYVARRKDLQATQTT